jgi:hypothetical protein
MDVFDYGSGTYDFFDACHATVFQNPVSLLGGEIEVPGILIS